MAVPDEVRKLIKIDPAELHLGMPIESVVEAHKQGPLVDAVERVLYLHGEARRLEISDLDRRTLRKRLLLAAGRLHELIKYDRINGRESRNRRGPSNLELFSSIAKELDVTVQHLHDVCAGH
jgi:hypothetical protein